MVLAVVGAATFIFFPYPREGDEVWIVLGGGAAAVVGLAMLFFKRWRWDDRGWKMVWAIFLSSFCLIIVGFFLLPPSLHEVWGLVTSGLMLLCGGAVIYGFLFGLRHIVKTLGNVSS
jgi:predicted tellurium resistance membrane protein TerC